MRCVLCSTRLCGSPRFWRGHVRLVNSEDGRPNPTIEAAGDRAGFLSDPGSPILASVTRAPTVSVLHSPVLKCPGGMVRQLLYVTTRPSLRNQLAGQRVCRPLPLSWADLTLPCFPQFSRGKPVRLPCCYPGVLSSGPFTSRKAGEVPSGALFPVREGHLLAGSFHPVTYRFPMHPSHPRFPLSLLGLGQSRRPYAHTFKPPDSNLLTTPEPERL
ncbi:hypothetical protein NDU88_006516 [Pleurodeles waltl]|uniref:Uncharacterized protein n=1 Tax=Pleurodeles waltl TaxID=8319 RepID=A0AAV7WFW1_PLEWA|nr:hypothetical protein NDU88_006516 [Pleurodeles waltl]